MEGFHHSVILFLPFLLAGVCLDVSGKCQNSKENVIQVSVNTASSNWSTDEYFVSFGVSGITPRQTQGKRARFKVDNAKFQNLARALAPCSMRHGGTGALYLSFMPGDHKEGEAVAPWVIPTEVQRQWEQNMGTSFLNSKFGVQDKPNMFFDENQWLRVTNFLQLVGWDLVFDINDLLVDADNIWDSTNFELFLNFSQQAGVPIQGFQIGNEVNSYHIKFRNYWKHPSDLVAEYRKLHALKKAYPLYAGSELIGPEITSLVNGKWPGEYLRSFLEKGAGDYLDAIGVHHYYLNGHTATLAEFMDPEVFDKFQTLCDILTEIRDQYAPKLKLYLTETGSAFGGGSKKYSRSFVSSFMYLDQLGMAAKKGISRVYRQSFVGGSYGIVDANADPRPDYFVARLHKHLIRGPVLAVDVQPQGERCLRVYAHCASHSLPEGSIVVYYVNLSPDNKTLAFSSPAPEVTNNVHTYILTSADPDNLASGTINLNGRPVELDLWGDTLPDVKESLSKGALEVPGHSVGFIVITMLGNQTNVCSGQD